MAGGVKLYMPDKKQLIRQVEAVWENWHKTDYKEDDVNDIIKAVRKRKRDEDCCRIERQ